MMIDEAVQIKATPMFKGPSYRTKKVQLVLFGGKARVGKTTAADYLFHQLKNKYPSLFMEHTGFAKPVKEIAEQAFHWDGKKDEKGRRLLQVIGTDAGRAYNENIWVEYMENHILHDLFIPNVVLIDDWRFPNEASYFEDNFMFDVTKIRIEREAVLSGELSKHASENAIPTGKEDPSYYNFVIDNDSLLNDFYGKLDYLIRFLQNKIIEY